MNRSHTLAAAVLIALACVAAGCSSSDGADETASAETTVSAAASGADASADVQLTVEASSPSSGVVEVTGRATVPDGARISWALTPESVPDQCPVDVEPEDDPCNAPYGPATVTDQRFRFRVEDVHAGPAALFVGFDPLAHSQPEEVVQRYGPLGQRMTGDQVVDFGGGAYRAQVTQTITVAG